MLDFFLDVPEEKLITLKEKGKIEGLFKKIEANLNPELVTKTNAVFHFVVKGK